MSEQILWDESLHHPGGEGGPCLLVLCLSVFVSVCLWVCGGAGAGGGWVPARAVSVCLRVCLPASVWWCAQSLKVLGSVCDILGRNAGAVLGIFGASPLTNLGGPSGIVWGTLRQNCDKGLGRPWGFLKKSLPNSAQVPSQSPGKSWGSLGEGLATSLGGSRLCMGHARGNPLGSLETWMGNPLEHWRFLGGLRGSSGNSR